jgi:hypothetical protein
MKQVSKTVRTSKYNKSLASNSGAVKQVESEGQERIGYFRHTFKCMPCGLHFSVMSDYENWPKEGTTELQKTGKTSGGVYCPECGNPGKDMFRLSLRDMGGRFIFQDC